MDFVHSTVPRPPKEDQSVKWAGLEPGKEASVLLVPKAVTSPKETQRPVILVAATTLQKVELLGGLVENSAIFPEVKV